VRQALSIALALILAISPLRAALTTPCECAGCGDAPASAVSLGVERACCIGPLEAAPVSTPTDDGSSDLPCPDDDCPRPCCVAGSIAMYSEKVSIALAEPDARVGGRIGDQGEPSSAHLETLPKPPKHTAQV